MSYKIQFGLTGDQRTEKHIEPGDTFSIGEGSIQGPSRILNAIPRDLMEFRNQDGILFFRLNNPQNKVALISTNDIHPSLWDSLNMGGFEYRHVPKDVFIAGLEWGSSWHKIRLNRPYAVFIKIPFQEVVLHTVAFYLIVNQESMDEEIAGENFQVSKNIFHKTGEERRFVNMKIKFTNGEVEKVLSKDSERGIPSEMFIGNVNFRGVTLPRDYLKIKFTHDAILLTVNANSSGFTAIIPHRITRASPSIKRLGFSKYQVNLGQSRVSKVPRRGDNEVIKWDVYLAQLDHGQNATPGEFAFTIAINDNL